MLSEETITTLKTLCDWTDDFYRLARRSWHNSGEAVGLPPQARTRRRIRDSRPKTVAAAVARMEGGDPFELPREQCFRPEERQARARAAGEIYLKCGRFSEPPETDGAPA